MSVGAKSVGTIDREPQEGFSLWWWLVMPLVVLVAISLLGNLAPDFYETWIGTEQGLLEDSHVAITLVGAVLALRLLWHPEVRGRPFLLGWMGLAFLGCVYIAGEEASWGQNYLGWATPDSWKAINDQGETNLHNTSAWFDQKPRTLFELGIIGGGILWPLALAWRPALGHWHFAPLMPPALCLPVALLAELSRLPERLAPITGYLAVFPRPSEVQELYFGLFILFYLIVFRQRVRAGAFAEW